MQIDESLKSNQQPQNVFRSIQSPDFNSQEADSYQIRAVNISTYFSHPFLIA